MRYSPLSPRIAYPPPPRRRLLLIATSNTKLSPALCLTQHQASSHASDRQAYGRSLTGPGAPQAWRVRPQQPAGAKEVAVLIQGGCQNADQPARAGPIWQMASLVYELGREKSLIEALADGA